MPPDAPQIIALRQDITSDLIGEILTEKLGKWPALREEQFDKLIEVIETARARTRTTNGDSVTTGAPL